ncbi:MAG: hypothetical protein ABW174_14205 [Flavitalea sp.]
MKLVPGFLLFSFVALLSACGSNDQDVEEVDAPIDSAEVEKIDTVLTGETISFFNGNGFSEFAKSKAPGFDWSKFRMTDTWQDDSLLVTEFRPAPNYYNSYKTFLKYSPDSTMLLDLDSYNLSINRDNAGNLVGIENGPDTEISLVNIKSKKKTRLLFLGPGNSVEDGSWIDNENLVLMGFQESGNGTGRVPVLWRYHLPTTTFYIYEMPDKTVATQLMGQWRRERLKGVKLK